jgi:hypothetical protein
MSANIIGWLFFVLAVLFIAHSSDQAASAFIIVKNLSLAVIEVGGG